MFLPWRVLIGKVHFDSLFKARSLFLRKFNRLKRSMFVEFYGSITLIELLHQRWILWRLSSIMRFCLSWTFQLSRRTGHSLRLTSIQSPLFISKFRIKKTMMRKKRVHIFQRSISIFLDCWLFSFLSLNSLSKSLVFIITQQSSTLSFLPHQNNKILNTSTFLIFFNFSIRYPLSRFSMFIRFILISKNSSNLFKF